MKMIAVILQLSLCTSLKLLESTYPTTPYKSVGNAVAGCDNVEIFGATSTAQTSSCATTSGATNIKYAVNPVGGSPCAVALEPVLAANKAAETADTKFALEKIADRCCQQIDKTAGDGYYLGWKALGIGEGRLDGIGETSGISGKCGGYLYKEDEINFYPTVQAGNVATPGGCKLDTTSGTYWSRKKGSVTKPVVLAPESTASGDNPDEVITAAEGLALSNKNNAIIEAARKQCSKVGAGWWNAYTPAGWSKQVPAGTEVCGGFCIRADTYVSEFFHKGTCYLTDAGATANGASQFRCYSSLGLDPASADMPKAFNDPKVVNLAGESFEILQTGTFQMIQVSSGKSADLEISATIDRAGSVCGATYIQNVSITGGWVQDLGVSQIHVRAAAALPKKNALQISTEDQGTWNSASLSQLPNLTFVDSSHITLQFKSLIAELSVDSHRIVEGSKKTRRFANFLNLNLRGLKQISKSSYVTGLLGSDSHVAASAKPADCETEDMKFISKISDMQSKPCPLEECGLRPPR